MPPAPPPPPLPPIAKDALPKTPPDTEMAPPPLPPPPPTDCANMPGEWAPWAWMLEAARLGSTAAQDPSALTQTSPPAPPDPALPPTATPTNTPMASEEPPLPPPPPTDCANRADDRSPKAVRLPELLTVTLPPVPPPLPFPPTATRPPARPPSPPPPPTDWANRVGASTQLPQALWMMEPKFSTKTLTAVARDASRTADADETRTQCAIAAAAADRLRIDACGVDRRTASWIKRDRFR